MIMAFKLLNIMERIRMFFYCICRYWHRNSHFHGFFGMDFESFVENVFDGTKGSGRLSSSSSLCSDIWKASGVLVTVSLWVCCCSFPCVDIFVGVGMSPDAILLSGAFFPGSYFLPLAARRGFLSATAKSLAICSCGYLELNNFFLIRKCSAAAKHLVGCLKGISDNIG